MKVLLKTIVRLEEIVLRVSLKCIERVVARRAVRAGHPASRVVALVSREIGEIPRTIEAALAYEKAEEEILSARLSRRFDPGMAVNEAANRAIQQKAAARQEPPMSAQQLAAYEFQQKYLQRIVERS